MSTSMKRQLSDYNTDGTVLGQDADDLISFYGADPVAQPSSADQETISSNSALTTVATAVVEIQRVLGVLGLWKGSA